MSAYRFKFAPTALHWDEPDAGCVHCGESVVTIDDHRCGTCLGLDLVHCPHCLGRIAEIVEREVARRWRAASHDVNDEWTSTKMLDRIKAAMEAHKGRSAEGAALRRDKLRERIYGQPVPTVTAVTDVTHPRGGGEDRDVTLVTAVTHPRGGGEG